MKILLFGIAKIFFTTFLVATITFFLLHVIPGNPFSGSKTLPEEIIKNLEERYHLNEPIFNQYLLYISGLLHGDFGPSLKYVNRSVNEILFSAIQVSFTLGSLALLISVPVGIFTGIISAVYSKKSMGNILIFLITIVSNPILKLADATASSTKNIAKSTQQSPLSFYR